MSKQVTLFAKPRFITLPKELENDTTVKYGSFFKRGERVPASGFTREEERYLLPRLVGTNADNPKFDEACNMFWADLSVKVPIKSGLNLNIAYKTIVKKVEFTEIVGTTENVVKQDVKIRVPENVVDFAIYCLAMIDERVAKTEEELADKDNFAFYISNPEQAIEIRNKQHIVKREASKIYNKFVQEDLTPEDKSLRNAIITTFKKELIMIDAYPEKGLSSKDAELAKQIAIGVLQENYPENLIEAYNDSDIKDKAFINKLLEVQLLEKSGNAFFNKDGEQLASDIREMVLWLNNKENSASIAKLKATLNKKSS